MLARRKNSHLSHNPMVVESCGPAWSNKYTVKTGEQGRPVRETLFRRRILKLGRQMISPSPTPTLSCCLLAKGSSRKGDKRMTPLCSVPQGLVLRLLLTILSMLLWAQISRGPCRSAGYLQKVHGRARESARIYDGHNSSHRLLLGSCILNIR